MLEAAGWTLFPLVIGRAIDGVLAGSSRGLLEFAGLGIVAMEISGRLAAWSTSVRPSPMAMAQEYGARACRVSNEASPSMNELRPGRIRPVNPPAAPTPRTADGSRRRRRLLMGLSAAVVLAAVGYSGVSMVVADRLTKPYRRPIASSPAVFDLSYEDVTFSSTVDGTVLRGWFLPVEGSDRAVVIVHGRSSSRTGDNGKLVAGPAYS